MMCQVVPVTYACESVCVRVTRCCMSSSPMCVKLCRLSC